MKRRQRRDITRSRPFRFALLALAAVEVLVFIYVMSWPGGWPSGSNESSREPLIGVRFVHEEAGFSFTHPRRWDVEEGRASAKVFSPGRDAGVAIGPGPRGNVGSASDRLLAELERKYSSVDVTSRHVDVVNGSLTLLLEGTAVNEAGRTLGFQLTAAQGDGRNYAIVAFATDERMGRKIEAVAASFEAL